MKVHGRGMATTTGAVIALAIVIVIGVTIFFAAQTPSNVISSTKASGSTINVSIEIGSASNHNSPGYSPKNITVVLGVNSTVTWTNRDNAVHTVTANSGAFDSHDLGPGKSFSYTFTVAGTYDYHCRYHSWMVGTVSVKP